MMTRTGSLLAFAIVICFFLVCYGITWGLPSRWCVDEPVARALGMISAKSIIPLDDYDHPTLHYFLLIAFLSPYLFFLKLTAYPLQVIKEAGSVSWIYLSIADPRFATAVYIIARLSSAVFAVLVIYLSYKLAKRCFSEKAGIFTALVLSVTAGFISESHQAKSTTFLIFMVLAVVLCCAYYYNKRTHLKYIVPFFLGGLTLAIKYNGGIVIFPLAYYLFILTKDRLRLKALAPASFITGFLIGFPGIMLKFSSYLTRGASYQERYLPTSAGDIFPLFVSGVGGYGIVLKDAFGICLFLLILCGMLISLTRSKPSVALKLVLLVIIPYCIIFSINAKTFELKYISLIIPFLVIAASGAADCAPGLRRFYKYIVFPAFILIWIVSFGYTVECDNIYSGRDIRYAATTWIKDNITKGRKIVIVGLPEWVVGNEIFKDYDISVVNNGPDFNQKYNRRFIEGRQYPLSAEEVKDIAKNLKKRHDYYVIYATYTAPDRLSFWRENESSQDLGIDIKAQKEIKEFSRSGYSFLWHPNIGGYEPKKIIISHGLRQDA